MRDRRPNRRSDEDVSLIALYESIDSQLANNGYCLIDGLFAPSKVHDLYEWCLVAYRKGVMEPAAIGRGANKKRAEAIRSDYIRWIDDWQEHRGLSEYLLFIEELMLICRQRLFIQAKRFEAHWALYPVGARYKKHIDQHIATKHRQVSCVLYLSPWQAGWGGELKLYPEGEEPVVIEPLAGRFVCFISRDMQHEVLPTNFNRASIAGWIRDDEVPLLSL